MAKKSKPADGEVFRFFGGEWELVESFGGNPPTADGDEIIVATGDEQMEASGGDCPVIVFFAQNSKLAAVIHVNAGHHADDYHETLVSAVVDRFPFPKSSKVHVMMDLAGVGKPEEERQAWLDSIVAYLKSEGFKSVATCIASEGKNVTLNAQDGVLTVVDGHWNPLLEHSY